MVIIIIMIIIISMIDELHCSAVLPFFSVWRLLLMAAVRNWRSWEKINQCQSKHENKHRGSTYFVS